MPIYEYRCQTCGARFTHFFRTLNEAEGATVRCPTCGAKHVRRLISRVAVHSGDSASADVAKEENTEGAERPVVFGRKELQEIMKQRERWRQEVEAEG